MAIINNSLLAGSSGYIGFSNNFHKILYTKVMKNKHKDMISTINKYAYIINLNLIIPYFFFIYNIKIFCLK